jgi:hypothetical protein
MATFILGGGVATAAMPSWVHHVLFYCALAAQGYSLWVERRVLTENERLMGDIDRILATPSPVTPAAVP